jgi:hypothetical protein
MVFILRNCQSLKLKVRTCVYLERARYEIVLMFDVVSFFMPLIMREIPETVLLMFQVKAVCYNHL